MADLTQVNSVLRETLVGDSIPYQALTFSHNVIRETLIKEAPILVVQVIREALVRLDNDDSTQHRIVEGLRQTAVMRRPTMAAPGTVHSTTTVSVLRQLIAMKRVIPAAPRSPIDVVTLRESAVLRRATIAAPNMYSPTNVNSLREQVVVSRVRAYVPVSMVVVGNLREQAVGKRVTVPASQMWSPLTVRTLAEQIVMSRRLAAITTDVFTASLVQQAVVKDARPAPHSPIDVRGLVEQVVQVRDVTAPGSDRRVGALAQQVVQDRDPDTTAIGMEHVAQLKLLTTMKRDTYPPAAAAGRHAASLVQQVVAHRDTIMTEGAAHVASLRVAYTMFRNTPLPIDVIDPTIGRHVASMHQQSVHQRFMPTPPEVKDPSRFVFLLREQVVHADVFDPPPARPSEVIVMSLSEQFAYRDRTWLPVSRLTVTSTAMTVAVSDSTGWSDPFVPTSEAMVFNAMEALVVGDKFVNPNDLLSAAQVMALTEVVAVADNVGWIDPTLPQSAIRVTSAHEALVVADPGWEDPRTPHSDVAVSSLFEHVAVHDDALSGHFVMSSIRVNSLVEAVVLTDPSMVGIPKRTGPRPVVSVSIS